jgi:hypothetical protein
MFKPKCEVCGEREAGYFSSSWVDHKWLYTCADCDPDAYWLDIDDFSARETTWTNHLTQKNWFDHSDFTNMIRRYDAEKTGGA